MLPADFKDRLNQMMGVKFEEIVTRTQDAFSRDSAETARRGLTHSSYTYGLYQKKRSQEIEMRVSAVVECQKLLLSAMRIPFSTTLASELKTLTEAWVTLEWCERSLQSDPDWGLQNDFKMGFREETLQARNMALRKAAIEIDLLVDGLRPLQNNQPSAQVKELDQKFKILLSPDQIKNDFDEWAKQLAPINGQIAVLFLDLDKFKELNTRYTEPKIDQDFLPDAMHLTERLVRFRGEAAKHGGDEYVLTLPNHDATEAMAFAEKLRRNFEQHTFTVAGDEIHITVSIGVALWPLHGSTYDDVLTKASAAKQSAKANRNKVVLTQTSTTDSLPLPQSGLSAHGQRLAQYLNFKSEAADRGESLLRPEQVLSDTKMTEEQLSIAADELRARGWVEAQADGSLVGFRYIQPTIFLFIETDPGLKGWDPRQDAKTVAKAAIEMNAQSLSTREVGKTLSWEPRRLNPAMSWLENRGHANFSSTLGSSPYRFSTMFVTPSTHRLASEA
ncbi:MAG TPA: GGDEF domain-containing protein [Nitrospira sp.]|nr:GGDEF domain-containing protein [Nitrospira sp.]